MNRLLGKLRKDLLLIICMFAVTACGSDDESEGSSTLSGKKLSRIIFIGKDDTSEKLFSYDNTGTISQIHQNWNDSQESVVSIYVAGDAVSWTCEGKGWTALLENGRVVSMGNNYKFSYDTNNRLTEIKDENTYFKYNTYRVTWQGDNISKLERIDQDGNTVFESIEYTYTSKLSHMLTWELYFNPFRDLNFLDTTTSSAFFYTGACGTLSKNLPATAVYRRSNGDVASCSYNYDMDSSGYPISITIKGEGYKADFEGWPVNIFIDWE